MVANGDQATVFHEPCIQVYNKLPTSGTEQHQLQIFRKKKAPWFQSFQVTFESFTQAIPNIPKLQKKEKEGVRGGGYWVRQAFLRISLLNIKVFFISGPMTFKEIITKLWKLHQHVIKKCVVILLYVGFNTVKLHKKLNITSGVGYSLNFF